MRARKKYFFSTKGLQRETKKAKRAGGSIKKSEWSKGNAYRTTDENGKYDSGPDGSATSKKNVSTNEENKRERWGEKDIAHFCEQSAF